MKTKLIRNKYLLKLSRIFNRLIWAEQIERLATERLFKPKLEYYIEVNE